MEFFERRAVCPTCRGEEFMEREAQLGEALVETQLFVTPAGFPEKYKISLIKVDGTKALVRRE
jgi:hypothetical protein